MTAPHVYLLKRPCSSEINSISAAAKNPPPLTCLESFPAVDSTPSLSTWNSPSLLPATMSKVNGDPLSEVSKSVTVNFRISIPVRRPSCNNACKLFRCQKWPLGGKREEGRGGNESKVQVCSLYVSIIMKVRYRSVHSACQ